jgi:hypothetical protein
MTALGSLAIMALWLALLVAYATRLARSAQV